MTRRTFCIDLDAPNGLDHIELADLRRRIAEALSYLGYVSFVDVAETTDDKQEKHDYWAV